jgi:hypothetical protein
MPQRIAVILLTATGIGSRVVLTVGNAILAHALVYKAQQKNFLWFVLLLAWLSTFGHCGRVADAGCWVA